MDYNTCYMRVKDADAVVAWQDLMRDCGVIDAVVETLDVILNKLRVNDQLADGLKIGNALRAISLFLSRCVKQNIHSQEHLLRYQELLLAHIGANNNLVDTVKLLLENNDTALDGITPSMTDAIFQTMRKQYIDGAGPRFASLLAALCTSNGVPKQRSQNVILESLTRHPEVMVQTSWVEGKLYCVEVS